jgi:hypothetical protein
LTKTKNKNPKFEILKTTTHVKQLLNLLTSILLGGLTKNRLFDEMAQLLKKLYYYPTKNMTTLEPNDQSKMAKIIVWNKIREKVRFLIVF